MAKFQLDVVESLDYDFTAIPSNKGKGMCRGKGTIPEPTQERLAEYGAKLKQMFENAALPEPGAEGEDPVGEEQADAMSNSAGRQDTMLSLTAQLCMNTPSTEDLEELPPRYLNAFFKWVYKELTDPEV